MSKVGTTLYEINQQGYSNSQVQPLKAEVVQDKMRSISHWMNSQYKGEYIGVLCRDSHDYTIIHLKNKNQEKFVAQLKELLENRGEIMDIDYVLGDDYYQIWVRERRTQAIDDLVRDSNYEWQPVARMYIVFDATDWVIEID